MTKETATELVRYYLMSHGVECEEIDNEYHCFAFKYKERKFRLRCWSSSIDIRTRPGGYYTINLKYYGVDETNPAFDPEKYFKPLLIKLNE